MRRRALSKLALGNALDVAHTTVARWLAGATPRGAVATKLASYFEVPIEALFDDAKLLPYDEVAAEMQSAKEGAQAAYPENPEASQVMFHLRLELDQRRKTADRLRTVIAELATIARDLDHSDPRLQRIVDELSPK